MINIEFEINKHEPNNVYSQIGDRSTGRINMWIDRDHKWGADFKANFNDLGEVSDVKFSNIDTFGRDFDEGVAIAQLKIYIEERQDRYKR